MRLYLIAFGILIIAGTVFAFHFLKSFGVQSEANTSPLSGICSSATQFLGLSTSICSSKILGLFTLEVIALLIGALFILLGIVLANPNVNTVRVVHSFESDDDGKDQKGAKSARTKSESSEESDDDDEKDAGEEDDNSSGDSETKQKSSASNQGKTIFCTECGNSNPATAKFCRYCGSPLDAAAKS